MFVVQTNAFQFSIVYIYCEDLFTEYGLKYLCCKKTNTVIYLNSYENDFENQNINIIERQ
jgi:hypothetical protein